jgi:hypothetical protein
MRPIWLIATSFLRQNLLAICVLLFYIIFFSVVFTFIPHRKGELEGFSLIFKQQATYGLLFSIFLCLSAVYQERKSKRILAVLSKGILRSEYLAGQILGAALFAVIYCGALELEMRWFAFRFHFEPRTEGVIFATLIGALVASALALVCGSVLHPYIAAVVCSLLIAAPGGLAKVIPPLSPLFPVSHVFYGIIGSNFEKGWQAGWLFLPFALLHLLAIWLVGSALFHKTDVTVALD